MTSNKRKRNKKRNPNIWIFIYIIMIFVSIFLAFYVRIKWNTMWNRDSIGEDFNSQEDNEDFNIRPLTKQLKLLECNEY